ncbi:hypothetical protein C484_03214 [Natrialba taiwanensis DSM 12281]|uniref:Uncharacterized protein n=1 Tax=Natrialba taiwanensis DSM 12281 TaxID=1230458 RepID=M0ABR1_9EURY|nr:hypothetical protein C484_03214 [Natrialba taiwanensis DSM 12281]
MSDRRCELEDEDDELVPLEADPPDWPSELEDDPVEYLVDVFELEGCLTSVPKSVQSAHTSNFAPSTLMVFGDDVSAPHISH